MSCAKKLGKKNEKFIVIWYDYDRVGWLGGIKSDATYVAAY